MHLYVYEKFYMLAVMKHLRLLLLRKTVAVTRTVLP